MRRHLLLLAPQRLHTWSANWRALAEGPVFEADEAGLAAFARWLDDQGEQACYTLATDLADEQWAVERLPPLRGHDRRALIARRLAARFGTAAQAGSLPLGRRREGESVLLYAPADTRPLDRWLAPLTDRQARITGVHAIAFALDRARRHRPPAADARSLLVSTTAAGLRHSLVVDGRLRHSRLLAAGETDGDDALRRTRAQLYAQGLIEHDDALPLTILDRAPAATADPVLRAALDGRLPHCGDEALRLPWRIARLRSHLTAAAFVVATVGSLATIGLQASIQAAAQESTRYLAASAELDARRQADLATQPPLPADIDTMTRMLEALAAQRAQHADPVPLLQALGQALDAHPAVELQWLAWKRQAASASTPSPVEALDLGVALDAVAREDGGSAFLAHLGGHPTVGAIVATAPDRNRSGPQPPPASLRVSLQGTGATEGRR